MPQDEVHRCHFSAWPVCSGKMGLQLHVSLLLGLQAVVYMASSHQEKLEVFMLSGIGSF